jgi:hypothetical protein
MFFFRHCCSFLARSLVNQSSKDLQLDPGFRRSDLQ